MINGSPPPGSVTIRVSLVAGGLLVAITEGLGALRLLAPLPVVLTGIAAVAAAWGMRSWWLGPVATPAADASGWREGRGWWMVIAGCLVLTFVAGFFGAPNAWDGLTYHLPRVERWVEQRHLGFWPTSIDRQLWMSPLGGYAILQFRVLTGGDRLAFLPSWLAYLGCILLAARVARQLGGDQRQAAFGALGMASLPVAVLHASSVQTDLLVAFWALCAASLALDAIRDRAVASDWRHGAWLGVAVGLAVATKGTAWLALLPWLLLYGMAVVRAGGVRGAIRPGLIGVLIILALNAPHLARNLEVFGDPLGDPVARGFLRLSPWTPNAAAANLLANLSLHLGTPWAGWNEWWTTAITGIQRQILSVDPGALFPYFGGFQVGAYVAHESVAGNPAHLMAGLLLVGATLARWRSPEQAARRWWILAGVTAVVFHGATIRWQPYGARLQLAALVWLAPAVAVAWRSHAARLATAAGLLMVAGPALLGNTLRPLAGERSVFQVPRRAQYFAERPALQPVLERLAGDLAAARCTSVGLVAGYDTPEYLLRVVTRTDPSPAAFHHLAPWSASVVLGAPGPARMRCAVVAFHPPPGLDVAAVVGGAGPEWIEGTVALFLEAGESSSPPGSS